MTFDEIHARYSPFLVGAGFTLIKKWNGMGRAVEYASDTVDLMLSMDYLGYMEVRLSPHLCQDRYRWSSCDQVRLWVLDPAFAVGPRKEGSPESSLQETVADLEFLKEQLPKVRRLFSPDCYSRVKR